MQVAIVDYGSGNLRSAAKAFERAARESSVTAEIVVTGEADAVAKADRIVLPGVGAFGDCAAGLGAVPGLKPALEEAVIARGRPFFGICVGMQLMAERGIEFGIHQGLGWIKGEIVRLAPRDPALKLPHMGWNELIPRRDHPLLRRIDRRAHAYFVHGFALVGADPEEVVAEADYGGYFPAVVARDNLVGTQFHPEKSQAVGLGLIADFLRWSP